MRSPQIAAQRARLGACAQTRLNAFGGRFVVKAKRCRVDELCLVYDPVNFLVLAGEGEEANQRCTLDFERCQARRNVERIEVRRGPQGTLYGRNSIGGAVKYVTRLLPQEFSLKLKGTLGTYDRADGPEIEAAGLARINAYVGSGQPLAGWDAAQPDRRICGRCGTCWGHGRCCCCAVP